MCETSNTNKLIVRCGWLNKDTTYIKYHDEEWGKPVFDNLSLFETLCLEGQQAGLSWLTILKKRDNYRKVFHNFDPHKISKYTSNVEELLKNSNIIRHKGKIESIIANSKAYIEMENNGEDFSKFIWGFVDNKQIVNNWKSHEEIPAENKVSSELATALKKRGFKFVGSKICYAFMQACGLIDDHIIGCISRQLAD